MVISFHADLRPSLLSRTSAYVTEEGAKVLLLKLGELERSEGDGERKSRSRVASPESVSNNATAREWGPGVELSSLQRRQGGTQGAKEAEDIHDMSSFSWRRVTRWRT